MHDQFDMEKIISFTRANEVEKDDKFYGKCIVIDGKN